MFKKFVSSSGHRAKATVLTFGKNRRSWIKSRLYLSIILSHLEEEIFNIAYDIELEYDVIFGIIVYSSNFWFSQKGSIMPLFQHIQEEGKTI